jgi:hypothetical protein
MEKKKKEKRERERERERGCTQPLQLWRIRLGSWAQSSYRRGRVIAYPTHP